MSLGTKGAFQKDLETEKSNLQEENKVKQDNPRPLFEGLFRTTVLKVSTCTGVVCWQIRTTFEEIETETEKTAVNRRTRRVSDTRECKWASPILCLSLFISLSYHKGP